MWLRDRQAPEYTFQLAMSGSGDLTDHARLRGTIMRTASSSTVWSWVWSWVWTVVSTQVTQFGSSIHSRIAARGPDLSNVLSTRPSPETQASIRELRHTHPPRRL